ncbi:MAG: DUF4435 domain-containing protein [Spirulinaceae cyanobacterium SM2_1_0]|nr:DUF4435 domain-containing protein [Spirulinaceae cyanobacterium SM2_1_0]
MSVVSAGTKLVFCEGKPKGLDATLLQSLDLSADFVIKPSGGKRSLAVYAQVELAQYSEDNAPSYLTFRDRDFDAEPPPSIQLIQPFSDRPVFYTHRACIENYLLDAQAMDAYWQENSTAPRWQYGSSPGLAALTDWIEGEHPTLA